MIFFPTLGSRVDLKPFRWKDQSVLELFAKPDAHKASVIEPLIMRFPRRRFALVGDSGERDPEIYGALARRYPGQVARVLIRDGHRGAGHGPAVPGGLPRPPAGDRAGFQRPGGDRGCGGAHWSLTALLGRPYDRCTQVSVQGVRAMIWETPSFEEVKMDAEVNSYQDDLS